MKTVLICLGLILLVSVSSANAATSWQLINVESVTQNGPVGSVTLSGNRSFTRLGNNDFVGNGVFEVRYAISPSFPSHHLFTHQFDQLQITAATGDASAAVFQCIEGLFGTAVGANLCNNYNYGDNYTDEGGTGDDVILGPPQSVNDYDGMMLGGAVLPLVTMNNFDVNGYGYELTFQQVPVPAAGWLFGSALVLMLRARRRRG